MYIQQILSGAPPWVYALLAALVALGIRRLKAREVPIFVALIPVIAFFIWSIFGAVSFAALAGTSIATVAWCGGAVFGIISALKFPETPPTRLAGGRVLLPGSWAPLILYLAVFVSRFICGAWAAINPSQAINAIAIGVAISAAMTARLATSVIRWRPLIA